eukprot:NODE_765_length_4403_cov_0.417054.p3 type:complete len:186 gc:universal NODE_765_length_4403_cov_0.417054:3691-4248(+)
MCEKVNFSFQDLVLVLTFPSYITHLDISNNMLYEMTLNLPSLQVLNASFNALEFCDLKECQSLSDLHLGYNCKLIHVAFSLSIKVLNITKTQIDILEIKNLDLQSLQCGTNFKVDTEMFPRLQVLNTRIIRPFIEVSSITQLPFTWETSLNCKDNPLLSATQLIKQYEVGEINFDKVLELMALVK